ncbi:MAG: preprotein translocase subunit SecE [Syntrophomonas sp.]
MNKNNIPAVTKDLNIKGRWENAKQYLINVYSELKKVHWPGRQQMMAYTGVVLFSVTLVALIIWLFDSGLSFLLEKLFNAFA